jgi:molybdopterin-guanine dinucleotide biosynthesis protein A
MPAGRETVAGVILAGGRGTRMGGADKGWVAWQGRPLVERVLERLQPQVGQVLINANRNLDRYRGLGHPVVADDPALGSFAGPLAGMLAALQCCTLPWAAFVPCDAPALPADLVARLAAAAGPQDAPALAVCAGRQQPVFCLLPRTLAPRLAAALAAGEHRPGVFLESVGARRAAFEDAAAFANINAGETVGVSAAGAGDGRPAWPGPQRHG